MPLTKVTYSMIDGDVVNVRDFGATGDGVTNDTAAIQAAIDSLSTSGGTVYFPQGTYLISRTVGTHDHWGLKIPYSNITLTSDDASFARFNTNISTYALAYPLLFIGVPDSNASQVSNIKICNITFVGNNTQHNVSGSALSDNRYAIALNNASNVIIQNNKFFNIDSSAIYMQGFATYDYVNSAFYVTTTCDTITVDNNSFYAETHSTDYRALIHAIVLGNSNNIRVTNNFSSWCDDFVSGQTNFSSFTQSTSDTFTWNGLTVPRGGRGWVISNNNCFNSMEHAIYVEGMDVTISDNTCWRNGVVRAADQIKVRGYNNVISGNTISNTRGGITIGVPSANVTVSNNTLSTNGDFSGAAIEIDAQNFTTAIDNRPWFDVLANKYRPMSSITIDANSITFAPNSTPSGVEDTAIRIATDNSDANFPNGEITGLAITGNTITNHRIGIRVLGPMVKGATVSGNAFMSKPFTEAGFNGSTTMNTWAVMTTDLVGSSANLLYFAVSGNTVYGSKYVYATDTGAGTASTFEAPWGITGNKLDYIQNLKTADCKFSNQFRLNTGTFFLDRTFAPGMIDNSLYDGTTANSIYKYTFEYDSGSGKVRFYTDDSGTFIQF